MAEAGGSLPGYRARRLLAGRGRYVGDMAVPGMLHAAFLRSPHAHAAIRAIDTAEAAAMPGVAAVYTAADLAPVCAPWRGVHALFPDLKAAWQTALAADTARFVGEPVAIVLAESRAEAEDAVEAIAVDFDPLPARVDPVAARDGQGPPIHGDFGTDIAFTATVDTGDTDTAFAEAAHVAEAEFRFARHTGVPLEPRGLLAEFEPTERRLTVHISHQCPAQMQDAYARLLGLEEHRVRMVAPDVGGAFGIKQQLHADEIATAAAAILVGRPVRFLADRLESFLADIQAREHVVRGRLALDAGGRILAFDIDDLFAIGPYSQYPRTSLGEGRALLSLVGAPYAFAAVRARTTVVHQTKGMAGHYRGVGHPIACAVTEGLMDAGARGAGLDPLALRRRNLIGEAAFPYRTPTGVRYERLRLGAVMDALEAGVDLDALTAEREAARAQGRLFGVGLAVFVEMTARGPTFYGDGEVAVSTRDGCVVKLEPSGVVRCQSSVTEQGQGAETGVWQVVAETLGVSPEAVDMTTGDSAVCYHGGGTWASRSMAIGGRAAREAAAALKAEILALAAALLQNDPDALDLVDGVIVARAGGAGRMSLGELAAIAHFRPHLLPGGHQPRLIAAASYGPTDAPFRAGCGVQLSVVEIEAETGLVRPLSHAVAHDCGPIVNTRAVEEQLRGGIVQGIGAALYEELHYDADGQLLNGSLADYLVPMAGEMPDIAILHVPPDPSAGDDAMAGVGEAGTAGAPAALLNAVNDALAPRAASLFELPMTPERVLRALGVL
ncbi:MAG: xanthine dehydrogenase family protein molybdopterin-binding subunit [Azospirillaceae bacterium]